MRYQQYRQAIILSIGLCLPASFSVNYAEARHHRYHGHGPRHHHHHHYRGDGSTAAVAFAVGAVATLLTPPSPPPVVVHQHGYLPYPPRPYYVAPPEVIYQPVPVAAQPVIVNMPAATPTNGMPAAPPVMEQAPAPPQPMLNGPAFQNPTTQPGKPAIGTVVDRLPTMARRVERNGTTYFEENGVYFLPVQFGNEPKFVVVQP